VAQATKNSPDAVQVLLQRLDHLTAGEAITHDRMVVFPIFPGPDGKGGEVLKYQTLEQAIAAGFVQVTEHGSATVPELRLQNTGQTMVLIFDGEEIVGGQQNRVVNTTLLVPAIATFDLPVSCVEQGRWHATSRAFASGESAYYALVCWRESSVSASAALPGYSPDKMRS
jgi:hypothetical protein